MAMRIRVASCFLVALCAQITACKDAPTRAKVQTAEGTSTSEPALSDVNLSINGEHRKKIEIACDKSPVPLHELLAAHAPPLNKWVKVYVFHGKRKLMVDLAAYSASNVLARQDSQGLMRVGLYPNRLTSAGGALQEVVDVDRIEVWTEAPPVAGAESLVVWLGKREMKLSARKLDAAPLTPWRGDGRKKEVVAWTLATLLEAAGADPATAGDVVLEGAGDAERTIAAADLGVVLIRRSSRGGFQAKQLGDNGKSSWRLKGLAAIRVPGAS